MIDLLIRVVVVSVCAATFTTCLALAASTLRVMVDLIKAGPGAAEEAYRSGDSLRAWWTGKHPNPTRRSMVGRHHKTLGVVMEEVGSRDPRWMR